MSFLPELKKDYFNACSLKYPEQEYKKSFKLRNFLDSDEKFIDLLKDYNYKDKCFDLLKSQINLKENTIKKYIYHFELLKKFVDETNWINKKIYQKCDEIILNRMYVGEYLSQNIGHEIINLFKADNGNNYIYLNPYGSMSKEHNDKTKAILLVRYGGKNTMEILAKATDLKQIAYVKKTFTSDREKMHFENVKYLDENNITYGNSKLYNIFKNNKNNECAVYITFKANSLLKPKEPLFITDSQELNGDLSDYRFANQSLRMYVSKEKHPNSFEALENLINNNQLWEEENSTFTVAPIEVADNINFLKIIGKENDELAFSNLFAYFFNQNKKAFCKFAQEILKITDFNENFEIKREYACDEDNNGTIDGFVDLLIFDKNKTITIENKIKSGINGVSERHDINSELVQSQLKCYHRHVSREYTDYQNHFYIFAPDYNKLDISKHECANYYSIIKFSKIYNWFNENKYFYQDNKYFEDFLSALYKHTKAVDNSLEEEMHKKFVNAITNSIS